MWFFLSWKSIIRLLPPILTFICVACNNGSVDNNIASLAVPTTTYQEGAQTKFALYTSVGGGKATLTEIDTGSDFYMIESSYVGTNIKLTNESITLIYNHGTVVRSGRIAYALVSFLNLQGESLISTNGQMPIVVVPDGVVSPSRNENHAIMGLRMNNKVSAKLYLTYPYNQMFIFDAPKQQLIFGNFSSLQLESFGRVSLASIKCSGNSVVTTTTNSCWNDMAVPVNYISDQSTLVESTFDTIFDSGAQSSFQIYPRPSWLTVRDGLVTSHFSAILATNRGNLPIMFTDSILAVDNASDRGIVNAGNNLFNYYQVLFDQQNGQIGLLAK